LTPAERGAWKKALVRVHQDQEGRIGKDLIQTVYKKPVSPVADWPTGRLADHPTAGSGERA